MFRQAKPEVEEYAINARLLFPALSLRGRVGNGLLIRLTDIVSRTYPRNRTEFGISGFRKSAHRDCYEV